jgi:pimeloyl-ACP methyl ester carboxylesterase
MADEFQDRYLTVNGLKLHYVDWGSAGQPPLLMLHGVTGSARHWDHVARAFRQAYHCLALDMRGFGDSQWSPDGAYESPDLAADLEAVFAALGLRGAVIVGASWGGLVGLMHAADHPETMHKLVLVDVGCEFSQPETAIPNRPMEFEDAQALEAFERSADPFPALWTLRPFLQTDVRAEGQRLVRKHDPVFSQRWPFRNWIYWDYARRVTCPTLLLRGARSYVLSPEMARRTAQSFANCRLVEIPDAGHLIALDNPPAFEAAVREFLSE